ncbi:hypothetical protein AB0J82_36660 [Asanoa sp. NPDC049518]|uniref:hypothetical protein n=1 Tax=unclassified Asanoa TaxID=2685164 RepID=UPI0034206C42
MSGLRWDDVQVWFDLDLNGSLPDVHVPETTAEDWRRLIALVQAEGWQWAYLVEGELSELAAVEDMLSRRGAGVALHVWPAPDVLAIFWPYGAEQIDFDVDLRELQGQERLDVLCRFFTTIGRGLRKPVLMTPEGVGNYPVLGYDPAEDRVVVLASE